MIRNYLKVAWRNLIRDKGFSIINISGLAIGMAAALLIAFWIQNELAMDREYLKSDRIYKMYNRDKFSGEYWAWAATPKVLGPTLKTDYPEVENMTRVSDAQFLFTLGDKKLNERGMYVDSAFVEIFDFPLLKGDLKKLLTGTYDIVVTQEFAIKLFGTEDAIGKTVKVDDTDLFTVTGVMENFSNTTTFTGGYLLPWNYLAKRGMDDKYWGNNSVSTYILLKQNASLEAFSKKVKTITIEHTKGTYPSLTEVFAYALEKLYLYGKSENGKLVDGRIVTVRMFAVIAGLILFIACINFMNLTTARSEKRAKEIGIRKVAGASRASLIFQFLCEGILLSFIAGVVAILIVQLSLSSFNKLVNKELILNFTDVRLWLSLVGFILFTGVVAGSYPAFYLSSFNAVKVLKGTFKSVSSPINIRKILVVLQFTFAIVLIISTVIIQRQIQFAQSRDLGYTKENLIYVELQGDIEKHYVSIKQALLSSGAVEGITKSMSPITQQWSDGWGYSWPGSTEEDKKLDFVRFSTDGDFTKVMGTKIVQGRDIDVSKFPTDSMAILLNEEAVKRMRVKEPIGMVLSNGDENLTVVGVVKDFIIASPYQPIEPMMIQGPDSWFNFVHIRLNSNKQISENLKTVESVFAKFNPNYPFKATFVDGAYAKKFDDMRRTATLSSLFSVLTILISCLGLFGLSAYMAANRTKEVGVRKVLGASVSSIVLLLSKDFLKLIIIAFLIATPIAWYVMSEWLTTYKYRISIEWWVFAVTALVAVLIALITVSFQAIKAAMANPVKSLRTE